MIVKGYPTIYPKLSESHPFLNFSDNFKTLEIIVIAIVMKFQKSYPTKLSDFGVRIRKIG